MDKMPLQTKPPSPSSAAKLFAKNWPYIILLALLTTLVFASFLFSNQMLFGSDTMAGLDSKVFSRAALDKFHEFPFWFSCRLSGMPTIDAMFGDALYLPSIIINALLPVHRALGIRLVLHVFLAGLFFFLMLRKGFKTTPLVALIGGCFYMFNPEFFSHIYPGHDGKMFVIAWLPFVAWRAKALFDQPKFFNATLLALGIAVCLYTSHIQMTYFVMWGLCLYWLMASLLDWIAHKNSKALLKMGLYFWLAVALGLGLAFIQLYPPLMFTREAFSVRGADKGFEYAASWSLHWPEVFSLWVPDFCGVNLDSLNTYWSENPFKLNSEYAGAMALLFGIIAIIYKRKPWRIFWGGVAALAVLFSLGAHTPVFAIAYYLIPGVKKFRASSMLMFWFSFSSILLATLFFKNVAAGKLSELPENLRKKWSKGLLIALGVLTALALLFSIKGFASGIMQPLTTALMDNQKTQIFDANFSQRFVPGL
ncbi:MAG: hypothetical protein PHC61_18625, partial [Chitinivibrionales bacterium]|nr:hypothetical protein [Chitinivibrionales bacterium]